MNHDIEERICMINNEEIPDGYKKVETGIIPETWEETTLGNRMRIFRGASPRPKGDPKYYGGNIPRLLIEDVTRDGKYVFPCIDSLTEEGAKKSRLLPKGSVVLSCSGTKVGIPGILGVDACIHDGFFGFNELDNVDIEYLYYLFSLFSVTLQSSATAGGVFNNLTTDIMKQLPVCFPPLVEQKKIRNVLSTWDKAITLKERLLIKRKELKRGLMQRLLSGQVRLSGYDGRWRQVKLGEVVTFVKKEAVENPQNYNLLTVKLHLKGVEATDRKPNTTEKGRPYYLREPNELLIGRQNFHNGGIGIVPPGMEGYVASNAISSLKVRSCDLRYIFFYLSFIYKRVVKLIGGTGQKEISESMLANLDIIIPHMIEEQIAIRGILDKAEQEIQLHEKQLDLLNQQKKGLMQLLLTGKVRVKC